MDAYLHPSLKDDFAHYAVRHCLLAAVKSFLPHLHGAVVDLGSGNMPYKSLVTTQPAVKSYLAIDWEQTKYYHLKPDLYWDGKTIPLETACTDCVLLTEVLEHLYEPLAVLREVHRILRPGGLLVGTTPFVWPLHEVPNDVQRFTPFGVDYLLSQSGFANAEITGAGGWKTSLAQFLCAYVGFGIQSRRKRAVAARLLSPLVKSLLQNDAPVKEFRHTGMVNLTVFKAQKPG